MFWSVWRLRDRAVAVVVAADPDRGMTVGRRRGPMAEGQWGNTVPVCRAVLAGTDLSGRKRCALIADADQSRGRHGAWVAVLVPAGGQEAVTAEARALASAGKADLAPEEGRDPDEVDGKVPVRAEVKGGNLAAARLLDSVEEAGPVRAEARDSALAEVGQCDSVAARHLASAAEVDSAPVPDRVEVRALVRAEFEVWTLAGGQVKSKMDQIEVAGRVAARVSDSVEGKSKMNQAEVVGRVSVRVSDQVEGQNKMDQAVVVDRVVIRALDPGEGQSKANQAEVRDQVAVQDLDGAEVRDRAAALAWASADRVAGSVLTDVRMLTCLARPSRSRKFHQKRHRVLRNLSRPKKVLPSERAFPNSGRSWQQRRGPYRINQYGPRIHKHAASAAQ